jgi:uncharacterized protein YecE (DUF72 family)
VKLPSLPRAEPIPPDRVRVGTAGWSYADWEGIVYPERAPAGFDHLEWIARFVDVVEINSTFYRPARPRDAASWARRAAVNPDLRFCAKLERVFTHEPQPRDSQAEKRFKDGIAPLAETDLLYAVLVQFPYSFRNTPENRRRLARLLTQFGEFRLAVELRHRSWLSADLVAFLSGRGVALVGIDQPQVGQPVPATLPLTAPFFYVRLHGRNAADWFRPGAGRDQRYNYLYAARELAPWVKRIRETVSESGRGQEIAKGDGSAKSHDDAKAHEDAPQIEGVVIANNHFRGQALVNAVEIRGALAGQKVPAPRDLIAAYPRLAETATPVSVASDTSGRLF